MSVLLALRDAERPVAALERSYSLATLLGHQLRVVRVVSAPSRLRRFLARKGKIEVMRDAHQATRDWLVKRLGEHGRFVQITIALGSFVQRVAMHARAVDCGLIVVAPRAVLAGSVVTALARRSNKPVLAARTSGASQGILAATDLRLEGLPVVEHAARLASNLHAELFAIHNVDPLWMPASGPALPEMVAPVVVPRKAETLDRRERLSALTSDLPVPVTPVVTSLIDPVYAILEEARTRGAGLIVVGTRQRTAWERLLGGSVAAQVVSRTQRSVLVSPITAP